MFPFWEVAIAPMLEAAEVRRIVEIGALRGENTKQIIDTLGPEAELHVIDPVPDFDPVEHERRFAGQYIFHQHLSVDVLGDMPPMDAALIDGDHNWYTVYNEMRLLAEVAHGAGIPMPLMVLHDVCWPYGRRDLYYSPDTIPAEYRQPHRTAGMRPGSKDLLPVGGLNPTMHNAVHEGGPRNGVMTGIEDFVAGYDKPLRMLVLPIYFGLAIVVEEERLAAQPALAAELDRLAGIDGKDQLIELGEDMRLRAMLFQHNVYFQRSEEVDRATARYLKVVKAALPTSMGPAHVNRLERCLDSVRAGDIPGDLAECGPGHGDGAIFMRAWLDGHEVPDRKVWVAGAHADVDLVRQGLARFDLCDDRVRFLEGPLAGSLVDAPIQQLALLRIGKGTGAEARIALDHLYDRVSVGGFVVVDDRVDSTNGNELEAFRTERGITTPLERVGSSAVAWRKEEPADAPMDAIDR